MIRARFLALVVALVAVSAASADDKWATVKGQVLFPKDKPLPKREALNVTQDKDHCLSKGEILDEAVIVNPKNHGVKNVVVWLRPDDTDPKSKFKADQITPEDAKRKPAEVAINQPCCMFIDRITTARPGDTIVVKNSAPVPHNFFWSSTNNGEFNITIPKMDQWKMPNPLTAENPPIQYKCTIHGWMTGYVRVFDHPYFAVTDENGNFEIKNAPVGKYRIVYWHENGFKGGAKGRFGDEVKIAGPTTELKPIEFDVSPKK
jgi:signal peptidase I